ncbi:MAG: tetratricopeptide repeat protein [bacterium]|nr:MAG: tetratricopeptide repeat protein [bacterium]
MEPLICSLLGEAYEGSGLLPEAILALRRAVDQGAHDCAVYRRLIQDYERTGQGDSARSTCEELRERKPGEATGHVLTAHLANLRGNYASAVDAAFRALEVEAGCPCALYELGLAYANMRSYEMALDPLMRATTRDPYDGEAFNLLGYVYLRSNRPLHAIVVLREATELTRGASAPWKSLGEAYSAAGLNARARDAYERAIEKDPGDVNLYVSLSREMAKEDGCEDAVKVLKRGLVECGPSAWLTYHLGKTYALGGQVDLARQQAQQLAGMNRNLSLQLLRVIELRDSL